MYARKTYATISIRRVVRNRGRRWNRRVLEVSWNMRESTSRENTSGCVFLWSVWALRKARKRTKHHTIIRVAHGFRATFLAQKRTGFHGESSTEERLKACCYHRRWITRTKKLNKTHKFRGWFVLHYNFPLLCSLFLLSRPLLKPYPPWFYHISVIPFPFVLLLSPWRCARTPEKF